MILTILVSMLVYIFWFVKSEFQRVLDRVDQSTLGIARMQRELTQSTVQQLNEQLQESFGRLEEEDDEEDEEENDEEGEEDEEENEEEGETLDTIDEDEGEENGDIRIEETSPQAELEEAPKKRGRKPKNKI